MRHRHAFTLIELLVAIAVITLLIALLLPALGRAREIARRVICLSNEHQIAVGMTAYATDCRDQYPLRLVDTPERMTNRVGVTSGWYDARPAFEPYFSSKEMFYCPSNTVNGLIPNRQTFRTHINTTFKNAGWEAIPLDVPADLYVNVDYTIGPGFHRKPDTGIGPTLNYLFRPDEPVTDLPNWGLDKPVLPDNQAKVASGLSPSQVPLASDFCFSFNVPSLTGVMQGRFAHWRTEPTAADVTFMHAHLSDGLRFEGLNTVFLDGSGRWRLPGLAGPRTNVASNLGPHYQYVFWY